MRRLLWPLALALLALLPATPSVRAFDPARRLNHRIAGHLDAYTNHHGVDRRIWSAALGQRRDMYVYLPPGYDPCKRYPLMLWLHGINSDERTFVKQAVVDLDEAIASGRLPPMIVAAPDGSLNGRPTLFGTNPLFLNSDAGRFEDYVIQDVWPFLLQHYPIRPEREAHVVAGYSGGGGAAFRMAIKYRETFGVVFALSAPLNIRWMDCHGRYMANFDPNCWGWREDVSRGREVIGRFYGVVAIRLRKLVYPLFGRGPEAVEQLSRENPIEMIDLYGLRPGELGMYVGYGGHDQFNMDAQVESFLYRARERGLPVTVGYERHGRHNWRTGRRLLPGALCWLAPRMAPYAPPACVIPPTAGGESIEMLFPEQ
jgi:S-formylglutathione hydrolase FrmB